MTSMSLFHRFGKSLSPSRTVTVCFVLTALAIGFLFVGLPAVTPSLAGQVLAQETSEENCTNCHSATSPGIVDQYERSSMAAAGITCANCHVVEQDHPAAIEHPGGFYVMNSPSPAMCQMCHPAEVEQFNQSRHGLPSYVAYAGSEDLSPEMLEMYEAIPEGSYAPDKSRNALYDLEGPDITHFACEGCHNIGLPNADGSVGQCQKCHLRHEFSLEQARKPETCNACHIGPDHPQWEIYQESPHGIAYLTMGYTWNWEVEPGELGVTDMPSATCATCHISGYGDEGRTHDVGERLTWYLFAPVSTRRPAWEENLQRMKTVCANCHSGSFIDSFYTAADTATEAVNDWVEESQEIVQPLQDQGLMTAAPFDQPIDFTFFNLWHHWGRTAKFGVWMQGPDYVQWHGAYEILHDLAELREMVDEKLSEAKDSN